MQGYSSKDPRSRDMPFPNDAHATFLDLALSAATDDGASIPARLEVRIVVELHRARRTGEALARLRRLRPRLSKVESFNNVRTAEEIAPLVVVAVGGGDAELASALKKDVTDLLGKDGRDTDVGTAARVARVIGESSTIVPSLRKLGANAELALDFIDVVQLHERGDPAWEPLFDSIEERLESKGGEHLHMRAFQAFLSMGLVRAAYRHWARAGKPASVQLVAALWREELQQPYRSVVESMRREEGDWSDASTNVDLAIAQLEAGDAQGARTSAETARRLAERGAAAEMQAAADDPPAMQVWYLASLISLERAFQGEPQAREMLGRCRVLLNDPAGGRRRAQAHATALNSLAHACARAGLYDEALAFARQETEAKSRALLLRVIALKSGSVTVARAAFDELSSTAESRVELALHVCRESAIA